MRIKHIFTLFEAILILCWLSIMRKSDSYYITYLIPGILGLISLYIKTKETNYSISKKKNIVFGIVSFVYSLTVVLANYVLLKSLISIIIIGLGSFLVLYNFLKYIVSKIKTNRHKESKRNINGLQIFCFTVLIIFVFYSAILILAYYPGVLTDDSINQITQIKTGVYSNHHPFYHTMIIKFWLDIGTSLFNDINIAIMMYSLFQILIVALTIAYCITTLYQMKVPLKYIISVLLFYVLMPYNIVYSFTMWKDILFSCSVLIFIVSLYRTMKKIGNNSLNCALLFIGSIGFMLLRSNGFLALLVSFCVMILFYKKLNKNIFIIISVAIIIAVILKGPVLKLLHVTSPDFVESLSIPLQQVARVIVDGKELSEEQYEEISKIVNIQEIPNRYKKYISDPIKWAIRDFGNQDYLVENKAKFLMLYLNLGIKYPTKYISAWVDQTKGYWNGGYSYWIWSNEISENDLGITRVVHSNDVKNIINNYLSLFGNDGVLDLFVSIGFNVWFLIVVFVYLFISKRHEFLLFLPIFFLIGTLLIATPVYSEFRYIYSMFLVLPFLTFSAIYGII